MLLSAPLAAGEPRLPPPFPPLFAPPLGCLMSGARDALKPPPPSVAAAAAESAAAALYPSYHHAGVAAASQLLHLHGYPASSHAVYPGFGYPVYPSAGAQPPLAAPPAEQRSGLYPLGFRPAVSGKEQLVAPPSSARAAPPSFAPDELRGFGSAAKDGVLRVPAQYPSHVAGVLPPPPPAATGDGSRAAYPAAGTPPRSAAPAQAGRFPFGARRAPSSEDPPPPRQRMLTADAASEQPHPAKRARLEPSRERPPLSTAAAAAAAAAGRVKSEMPSAVSSDHYVPPEHFRSGAIIELADGRLKPVEELRTEDFESSAEQCAELRLDRSVVTRIDELGRTAQIVFAVGPSRTEVTVEAQLEHPFFVFHRGWSSCSPRRTLQQYSLSCHQLSVGDACVSLAPRSPPLQTTQSTQQQSHQQQQQSHQQPGQQQSHQQQQQQQQGNHTARGAT